jgi:hypothetical protein
MRMAALARHFDREQAFDGYTDAPVFKCQYSSFDDSAGDGSTNRRRGMSTAPTAVVPARGVIRLADQRWIVGSPTDDSFLGEAQRKNYNLKRATDLLAILTPLQACQAATGVPAWMQRHYFKDVSNALSDSDYDTFWNVFVALTEPVARGTFLRRADGTLHRVRNAYPVAEGFLVAQTDQLDADARQAAVFQTGTYDPVADAFTAGTTATNVVQLDPTKFYHFRMPAESPVRAGDRMVVVPDTIAVKPGIEFSMQGEQWRVEMAEAATGVFMCLARLK